MLNYDSQDKIAPTYHLAITDLKFTDWQPSQDTRKKYQFCQPTWQPPGFIGLDTKIEWNVSGKMKSLYYGIQYQQSIWSITSISVTTFCTFEHEFGIPFHCIIIIIIESAERFLFICDVIRVELSSDWTFLQLWYNRGELVSWRWRHGQSMA